MGRTLAAWRSSPGGGGEDCGPCSIHDAVPKLPWQRSLAALPKNCMSPKSFARRCLALALIQLEYASIIVFEAIPEPSVGDFKARGSLAYTWIP